MEDSSTSGFKHSCLVASMSGLYSFYIYKESALVVFYAVGEEGESSDARWMLA
jgi:hypothetical protein